MTPYKCAQVMLGRQVKHGSPAVSPMQDDAPAVVPIQNEQEHQEALAILRERLAQRRKLN